MEAGARMSQARCRWGELLEGASQKAVSQGWTVALPLEGGYLGASFNFCVSCKKVAQEPVCAALLSARRPLLPQVYPGFSSLPLGPPATWEWHPVGASSSLSWAKGCSSREAPLKMRIVLNMCQCLCAEDQVDIIKSGKAGTLIDRSCSSFTSSRPSELYALYCLLSLILKVSFNVQFGCWDELFNKVFWKIIGLIENTAWDGATGLMKPQIINVGSSCLVNRRGKCHRGDFQLFVCSPSDNAVFKPTCQRLAWTGMLTGMAAGPLLGCCCVGESHLDLCVGGLHINRASLFGVQLRRESWPSAARSRPRGWRTSPCRAKLWGTLRLRWSGWKTGNQ